MQESDEWSRALDSRRARWEVAHLVDGVLTSARSPVRVSATHGGWVVRSGTGRTTVADTLTALWRAVGPLPAGTPVPAAEPATPVATAVHSSYERSHVRGPASAPETGGTA